MCSSLALASLVLIGCSEPPLATGVKHQPLPAANVTVFAGAGTGVVISQVYGAGGNTGASARNDYVELFNAGTASASLAGWSVQYASATGTGNFSNNAIALLNGTLAPGQFYLVQLASGGANGAVLPTPDATGTANLSGAAGKVVLANSTSGLACNGGSTVCSAAQLAIIIDLVGYGTGASGANFFEGAGPAPTLSATLAGFRKASGCTDTNQNGSDFVTGAPNARNSSVSLPPCPQGPTITGTTPANGAVDVPVSSDITITASTPVAVSGSWYTIACAVSGVHTATVSGGPTAFTLNPDQDFAAGETCAVTIVSSLVADQSNPALLLPADYVFSFSTLAANACDLAFTPAYTIQGTGLATTLPANVPVTTQGVVVGDYEGPSPALRGFFLQDITGDGDPLSSDAIFVFNANANSVALGDVVRVTGTPAEFQEQTQVSNVSSIITCSSGASVAPVDVSLPVATATTLERYEGMLVRFAQSLFVTEHFQLGRFGQVVLSSGARLLQPTTVATPGPAAHAVQAQNDLNRIILDDATNGQNADPIVYGRGGLPLSASNTLRGGDEVTGVTGVLTYTWAGNAASGNAYRLRPINALGATLPMFTPANPRPSAPPVVNGALKVGSMNLLNYFNTFAGCTAGSGGASAACRGAEDATEFGRQAAKTVAAIIGSGVDVMGVMEIENDGYGTSSAIADLVDRLNAATTPGTWAFIDADASTGQLNALGTDAIKVGLLYQPARVTPTGRTAALNSVAFVNGGDADLRNRPALLQAFLTPTRGRVLVAVNHLKSKGSACTVPDAGDGQGECNAVRTAAANQLLQWIATDPTDTGDPDVLIVGDLNANAKEDPITALQGGGFVDLIGTRIGAAAYSYAFDGQWGYLDHALASPSLAAQVSGIAEWHIAADEPSVLDYNTNFKSAGQVASLYAADAYRVADHDPVIVGLDLQPPPVSYTFGGFLDPVANMPVINEARAGRAIPITFSLGGDRGLSIFEPGSPGSRVIACGGTGGTNTIDEVDVPGQSGLSYDASSDTYTLVWKTDRSWGNTCRELVLRFRDETQVVARFSFVR